VLTSLLNKHKGCIAWVFGKGPSIDDYIEAPEHSDNDVKITVNEAVLVVEKPDYFFAHDAPGIARSADPWNHGFRRGAATVDPRVSYKYPQQCAAILRHPHKQIAKCYGLHAHFYDKGQQDYDLLTLSPEQLAESVKLYGESSTTQSACHFAKLIGAKAVVLVGIDGGEGTAKVFQALNPIKGYWYTKNRGDTRRILDTMGMPYRIWKPANVPNV